MKRNSLLKIKQYIVILEILYSTAYSHSAGGPPSLSYQINYISLCLWISFSQQSLYCRIASAPICILICKAKQRPLILMLFPPELTFTRPPGPPRWRANNIYVLLDILFSSNRNSHKSLYGLCILASDPLNECCDLTKKVYLMCYTIML